MVGLKGDLHPEAPPNLYSEVWDLVSSIPDPEVPCITIYDLGIIRELDIIENQVIIKLTPTYSGCPEINAIELAVEEKLQQNGQHRVLVLTVVLLRRFDSYQKEGR